MIYLLHVVNKIAEMPNHSNDRCEFITRCYRAKYNNIINNNSPLILASKRAATKGRPDNMIKSKSFCLEDKYLLYGFGWVCKLQVTLPGNLSVTSCVVHGITDLLRLTAGATFEVYTILCLEYRNLFNNR